MPYDFDAVRTALAERLAASNEERDFLYNKGWTAWRGKYIVGSADAQKTFPAMMPPRCWKEPRLGEQHARWLGMDQFTGKDPSHPLPGVALPSTPLAAGASSGAVGRFRALTPAPAPAPAEATAERAQTSDLTVTARGRVVKAPEMYKCAFPASRGEEYFYYDLHRRGTQKYGTKHNCLRKVAEALGLPEKQVKEVEMLGRVQYKDFSASGRDAQWHTSRAFNKKRGVKGLPKLTLESAQKRMLLAVETCHVDFNVGRKERLPTGPRNGTSRMRPPSDEKIREIFGIVRENGWTPEEGDTGFWVREPLPVPRPGTMHRDRVHGKDGAMPKGGLGSVQDEWLVEHVPRHHDCKTHKQAHKRGQYPAVAVAMAASLGFVHFIGAAQIQAWVERKRDAYVKSAAAEQAGKVAAAEAAAEGGGGKRGGESEEEEEGG
jgi:hypothetical protein